MYDPDGRLVENSVNRQGFTSQEIIRRTDGSFEIRMAPRARPGNWLPTGGIERYVLVLRLYDTPVGLATRTAPGSSDAFDHHAGMRMIRWLLWGLGGLLLGGVVHLATVLLLPRVATQDAYSRLLAIGAGQCGRADSRSDARSSALLPFMDPAVAAAVCRYDLANGPLKLTAPVTPAYTSVSFYTRFGVALLCHQRPCGRAGASSNSI